MKIATIALRNIFRNKRRSLLSLSAIAIVTMVIVLMFSVVEGMKADQQTSLTRLITGQTRVRNAEYEKYQFTYPFEFMINDASGVVTTLQSIDSVEAVEQRIQFGAEIAFSWDTLEDGTPIIGETFATAGYGMNFAPSGEYFSIEEYIVGDGTLPNEGELLIGDVFAQKFNVHKGDQAFLLTGNSMYKLTVSGLVGIPIEQFRQKSVFIPLATAQGLLSLGDQAQDVLVAFTDPAAIDADVEKVKTALAGAGYAGLEILPWYEVGMMSQWLELASVAYNFMALFFFIIATTVIVNTTMMVIYERMREIGTLRAMGMKGKEMIFLFFAEAFFIGLAAAFIGTLFGVGSVLLLSTTGIDLGSLIDLNQMNIMVSNVIYPQLNFNSTVFVFFYSVVVASCISFIPTRRAAKIEPIEALRAL